MIDKKLLDSVIAIQKYRNNIPFSYKEFLEFSLLTLRKLRSTDLIMIEGINKTEGKLLEEFIKNPEWIIKLLTENVFLLNSLEEMIVFEFMPNNARRWNTKEVAALPLNLN